MVLIGLGGMAFAFFQPIQVLPRIRLGPGYALTDSVGDRFSSEDARGKITLYTFLPADCGEPCADVVTTMSDIARRVPTEVDFGTGSFRMVTVVLTPDMTDEDVAALAADAGDTADDDWVWLHGDAEQIRNLVGLGFRRSADIDDFTPSYAIVDSIGIIRGEYRYATIADTTDKLIRHLDILGGELRNSRGFASFAYEAAHVFQCYP